MPEVLSIEGKASYRSRSDRIWQPFASIVFLRFLFVIIANPAYNAAFLQKIARKHTGSTVSLCYFRAWFFTDNGVENN